MALRFFNRISIKFILESALIAASAFFIIGLLPVLATKSTLKSPTDCVTVCAPKAPPEELHVNPSVDVLKLKGPCAKVKKGRIKNK